MIRCIADEQHKSLNCVQFHLSTVREVKLKVLVIEAVHVQSSLKKLNARLGYAGNQDFWNPWLKQFSKHD